MITRSHPPARLLVVAHGTASTAGAATTAALVAAIAAARPEVDVELCFLDVVAPRLPDTLAGLDGAPAILVPLLLSTGYHVQTDIPAAVAEYPHVRVARHLGPDPLLIDVLVDRLATAASGATTVLVGAGSSRPEAADELSATGELLAARLRRPVPVLTMGDDLAPALAALPTPVRVATYLLAEGQFVTTLCEAVGERGAVAPPLGVHPALVQLVWQRYDDAGG